MTRRTILGWRLDEHGASVARLPGGATQPLAERIVAVGANGDAELDSVLTGLARDAGIGPGASHALVFAPGWSARFPTSRESVAAALDAFATAFPNGPLVVLSTDGALLTPDTARRQPLAAAGATWAAVAAVIGESRPNALVVHMGPGRTDIVPLSDGRIVALGRTDPERLVDAELIPQGVYTTPVEAVIDRVPLWDSAVPLVPGRAELADVHTWRGAIPEGAVERDGEPLTHRTAGQRLAQALGGDRDYIDETAVGLAAAAVAAAQLERLRSALQLVRTRTTPDRVVAAGPGAFLAAEAAAWLRLPVERWAGPDGRAIPPETAVAWLLAQEPDDD